MNTDAQQSYKFGSKSNIGDIEREISQQYKSAVLKEPSFPNILLIDDEPMNLEVLGSLLLERGF